jgi:hypothetical protein
MPPAQYQIDFCKEQFDWVAQYAQKALQWLPETSLFRQLDSLAMKCSAVVDRQVDIGTARQICDECVMLRNEANALLYSHWMDNAAPDVRLEDMSFHDEEAAAYIRLLTRCQREKKRRKTTDIEHALAGLIRWRSNPNGTYTEWLAAIDAASFAVEGTL